MRSSIWKWALLLIVVVGLFVLARVLPVDEYLEPVEAWIKSLGIWGPFVFVTIYVLAVIFLFPAWIPTAAAGAIFGLAGGTALVSIASTTGAAIVFLTSRYFAREWVEARIKRYPRFAAIDKAIGQGGWKIVALLRLSPVVPFNLQNYLYGLTPIRFWPCVLTSWIAMLPGTFLYVYLGYLGRSGLQSASGDSSANAGMWTLRIVGLLATIVVTVYISRLARRELQERTELEEKAPA